MSANKYIDFENALRQAVCDTALRLNKSGLRFAVFAKTECNDTFWYRTNNGGWKLNPSANPANAIRDIFQNGWRYATECATAMVIVYYKALLEVYGDELFNKTFNSIYLMDWDVRDPLLSKVGYMEKVEESGSFLAGDRVYFANPDHDPALPQWQGENTIKLQDGSYYGHGIGIASAEHIINSLNSRRGNDNPRSAYLLNSVGRPDFKKLADIMSTENEVTVWKVFPNAIPAVKIEGGRGGDTGALV